MAYSVSTWNDLTGYKADRRNIESKAEALKEFDYQVKSSKLNGSEFDETVYLINKATDTQVKKRVIKGWKKAKRVSNPTVTASSLPVGEWSPAHAIRQNADGTIDVLREKNSGRRANISQGYMAGGVFHPIRSAADYDPSRVGEGGKKKKKVAKKKPATKKRATPRKRVAKKKPTRAAMRTSRASYWSD